MPYTTKTLISCFTVLFYFSVGLWLFFAETKLFVVSMSQQRLVGILFVLFSGYKGFMAYRKWRGHKHEYDLNHDENERH